VVKAWSECAGDDEDVPDEPNFDLTVPFGNAGIIHGGFYPVFTFLERRHAS
jgi:hypothetical protein